MTIGAIRLNKTERRRVTGPAGSELLARWLNLPRSRSDQRAGQSPEAKNENRPPVLSRRPCLMLGELVTQTDTRIFYRLRDGKTAWAMKSSKLLVHLEPCPSCRDHERGSSSGRPWAKAAQG